MARAPGLASPTLSPFGGSGSGFGAFSIVDPGREAYLIFLKVENAYQNGHATDTEYLAALGVYANALPAGSSTRLNTEQRLIETTYRVNRNVLIAAVEAGTKDLQDLAAFDKTAYETLDPASETYRDRLNLYQQTQNRIVSDEAADQQALYDAGKITTAQLRGFYVGLAADPAYAVNPPLLESLTKQITALNLRVTSEQDQMMVTQFRDGKLDVSMFLAYAGAARARYETGTEQEQQWTKLIKDAQDQTVEKTMSYQYGLSQQYIQLKKYIADQTDMLKRSGQGGTSSSTRIVLSADGHTWKTVTSTKTSPYKPSAAEVKAMNDRRIELADARNQLGKLVGQINDNGGFVTTDSMITFYTGKQADVVKGTVEWYQLQERIDGLNQQKHAETVMQKEGVKIGFGAATPTSTTVSVGHPGTSGAQTGYGSGGGGKATTGGGKATTGAGDGPLQIVTSTGGGPAGHGSPGNGVTSPRITTKAARFPTNLDGRAYDLFYDGFVAAYKNGETTFVDFSSGKAITYYIPEDLAERSKMIGELDALRVGFYATAAAVYAGTPSEIVASNQYSEAIKDAADNAYMVLVTSAKAGNSDYVAPIRSDKAIYDPIQQGIAVMKQAKAFMASEAKLAKEAMARGDFTGAWAHVQMATARAAETEAKMQFYSSVAQQEMAAIQRQPGTHGLAPSDSIQDAFGQLDDFGTLTSDSLAELDEVAGEVKQWVKLDTNGNPVLSPRTGTLTMRDGTALYVDKGGKVTPDVTTGTGYNPDGSDSEDVDGKVAIRINLGGTVPNQKVYADWTSDIVGYTQSGLPVWGRVVIIDIPGQGRTKVVEDPFHPGKWSQGMITFTTPGLSAVPGSVKGATAYQFTGADGRAYRLDWDEASGSYNLVRAGTVLGTSDTSVPLGEADAQAILSANGFGIDLSGVSEADRWKYDMTGAWVGFDKSSYDKFTTVPAAPKITGAPIGKSGLVFTGIPYAGVDSSGKPRKPSTGGFQYTGVPWGGIDAQGNVRGTTGPNEVGGPDDRNPLVLPAVKPVSLPTDNMHGSAVTLQAYRKPLTASTSTPKSTSLATQRGLQTATKAEPVVAKPKPIAPLPTISTTKLAALTKLA